jgi:hypothetical protein
VNAAARKAQKHAHRIICVQGVTRRPFGKPACLLPGTALSHPHAPFIRTHKLPNHGNSRVAPGFETIQHRRKSLNRDNLTLKYPNPSMPSQMKSLAA